MSFNEAKWDTHNLYQQEFLNSTAQGSIPPHTLKVKKGAPFMLLRNIDLGYGMCNGTRLLCCGLFKNMLEVEILTWSNAGKRAFLPRIKLKTNASLWLLFSHGKLYVPSSREISQNSTKVLIKEGKIEGEDEDFMKNVVFEIFFYRNHNNVSFT